MKSMVAACVLLFLLFHVQVVEMTVGQTFCFNNCVDTCVSENTSRFGSGSGDQTLLSNYFVGIKTSCSEKCTMADLELRSRGCNGTPTEPVVCRFIRKNALLN
eukprot:TRINITY_DN948_c0_g2_i1.p1 TRINITY_DN948_c0_g2~~TRINITY_DN948_c0_g2_i1.p1  ORF type:complete len:115 (-),score=19.53 TRINITY_DN948_c0_g2_i1:139-447(-)